MSDADDKLQPYKGKHERSTQLDERWQNADNEVDLYTRVIGALEIIDRFSIGPQQTRLDSYCLYGNRSALDSYDNGGFVGDGGTIITRNVLASAADAVLSEVTQTTPRAMFATIGGDYLERARAKKMTLFSDAKADELHLRALATQATRDAIICGLGILRPHVDPQSGKTRVDRIFPLHFYADDRNCIDVLPRTYYVRHLVDRWHLMELYPEQASEIESAPGPTAGMWYSGSYSAHDIVEVIEAIHLPSRADKSDGRRVLVIRGAVLSDEEYESDDPPFAFIRAVKPIRGFWGESLVQRAASTQEELNKLLYRIQCSMHLHATAQMWLPRQAGVVKGQICNDVGVIIQYDGPTPPTQFMPSSMSGEVYQYVQALEQEVFKLMGVSELAAQSLKPKGLNSGVALDNYNDVQSRRFIDLERGYEQLFCDVASLLVQLETEQAEDDKGREVVYKSAGGRTETIEWSKIALSRDRYSVRVFPASAMPTSPAEKIQFLQNMVDKGTLTEQEFYELNDIPDFESARNRVTAPLELLHKYFALILEDGEYNAPLPYMDLALALKECTLALQRATIDEAPEENIELLRKWLAAAFDLAQLAKAPQMPPLTASMAGGPPMGDPGAMLPGMPPASPPGGMPPLPPDMGMPPPPGANGAPPPMMS